jgi:HEAT repeat protein
MIDPDDDRQPEPSEAGDAPALGGERAPGGNEPWLGGAAGLQPLLDALRSGDNRAIWRAGQQVEVYGGEAIPRLVDLLAHPDYRARAVAARALGQVAHDERILADALPALLARLGDPVRAVRVVAAAALDRIAAAHPERGEEIAAAVTRFRKGGR